MNAELARIGSELNLSAPESRELALRFRLACAKRVEHLLEEPEVLAHLQVLDRYVTGTSSRELLDIAAVAAARLANQHRGSKSIDGCGHAAVSATYGVSKALAGKALEAAEYCAYAAVYAAGGYSAAAEREAFEPEFTWQVGCLEALAGEVHRNFARLPAQSDA